MNFEGISKSTACVSACGNAFYFIMNENSPIGVFDSGIGGLTVLRELLAELPDEDFIYFADSKNAPYGPRTVEDVTALSSRIVQFLVDKGCKIVVIACNTATAAAVYSMRKEGLFEKQNNVAFTPDNAVQNSESRSANGIVGIYDN